tara:strand:+ start:421 stop:654 length:234 start_codon:yes stop_codon:yes gene_type:complete
MFKARVDMLNPKLELEVVTPTYDETVKLLDSLIEKLKPKSSDVYSSGYDIKLDVSENDSSGLKITTSDEKLNTHMDL